jgi:hypothetical protein
MKNKMADLTDHLFAQIERLADESLTPEQIETEAKRGHAIVAVADQLVRSAELKIKAAKILSDHGLDPSAHLALEAPKATALVMVKKA